MVEHLGAVDGIVLAAGASRRMGSPKPLLEHEGDTFLERTIRTLKLGGCRIVVAVVGGGDTSWAARIADVEGALVARNDREGSDPIDSIRAGLDALPSDAAGVAILPVDHPSVRPDTVAALIGAFQERGAGIVRPVHDARPGHPGIFARRLFAELRRPDLPEGAHTVIESHPKELVELSVDDAGVAQNVDTPEDLRRLRRD